MSINLKKSIVHFFKLVTKNKKLNTYALFLFISFSFWFLSMLSKTHETTLSIAVNYKNYPTDLVEINSSIDFIEARVKAPGFSIVFYHFFNFNEAGLIQQQGDFFDATGMMNATGDKKLVVAELKIKAGKQDAFFALMANESYGLKATRNYKGCNSLISTFNEESNTLLVISDWDSYEEYAAYLTWRTEEDTELVDLMKPLLIGGMKGLRTVYPNSMYTVY